MTLIYLMEGNLTLVDCLLPVCDVLLQLFAGKIVILIRFENLKGIHLSTLSNLLVPVLRGKDLETLLFSVSMLPKPLSFGRHE